MTRRRAGLIGAQVVQVRYRHAGDGKYYRHDFSKSGTRLHALPDGSLRISNPAARLWGDYADMRFLENPPKRRRKSRSRGRAKGTARRRTRAAAASRNPPARKRAKRRKGPPAGFSSWSAWAKSMQAHRSKGGTVAKRRRRRSSGRSTARRSSSRRRSYRSNPPGRGGFTARGIMGKAQQGVTDGAGVLAGQIAARAIPTAFNLPQAGTLGLAVQVGAGLGAGVVASKFVGYNFGRLMIAGAFAAVYASLVKRANIPVISAALGDEGDVIASYPTQEIAAYPYGQLTPASEVGAYPVGGGGPYGPGQSYSALDMQQ